MEKIMWLVLGGTACVAAVRAGRSRRAMYVGRAALGVLFIAFGALVNAIYLTMDNGYYDNFADASPFAFVKSTWHSLVLPHQGLFITLLILFEATMGVLVLSGGRWTQVGLVGLIGFHIGQLAFGGVLWPWAIMMLVALTLLLRAERHPAADQGAGGARGGASAAGPPLRVGAIVAAAFLVVPGSVHATDAGPTSATAPGEPSIADAERVLRQQLDRSGIPGGAVVVVSGGHVEARGVGDAGDGRKVTAATPFVLGSATKSFTALAVMELVDAGQVALDSPVRTYVPELKLAAGEPVDDITVRQVLQHTSGLDDIAGGGPLLASATDGTAAQAIAELTNARLVSKPGQKWRYANANYVLAGLVVEHVSGLSYGEFVQRHIFDPLGMTHSYVTADAARSAGLAKGHRFWFGVPAATGPVTRHATLAAGYLISTADDLGRYLAMYLAGGVTPDGHRLVSTKGVATLMSPGPRAHLGPWAQGQASRYAMGWFRGGPWGRDVVFHPGNSPDSSTMLTMFPDRGIAVATVVNAGNELPVPGNPFIADRVARNVIHAALGQPGVALPSIRRFYLVFDLAALALLAAAGWAALRALRAVRSPRKPLHRILGWVGVAVRALTVAALVVLPLLTYNGWRGAWTWAPDLTLVLGTLALLLTTTTALRLLALTRRRHPDALPSSTAETSSTADTGGQHVHA